VVDDLMIKTTAIGTLQRIAVVQEKTSVGELIR
jgi:hypothetical protein